MLTYLTRRVLASIPVLLIASFVTFWGIRVTFNPLTKYRGTRDAAHVIPRVRKQLGLDRPIVVQWWKWLTGFLHGNLGTSYSSGLHVSSMLLHAMWPTLQLMFWGTILSIIVALAVGVYSAARQYSIGDYVFTGLSYVGIAMPAFVFGLVAIALFVTLPTERFHLSHPVLGSIGLHSGGVKGFNLDYLRHLALPVLTLSVQSIASWSRFERASMLEVLNTDYVRTARAKGVPRRKVIFKHALRNALIPFVTITALDTAFLIGGLIITEQIFSISGMGSLFVASLFSGDAPVLLGWFVISALFVIGFNLLADVAYCWLDPRIRLG